MHKTKQYAASYDAMNRGPQCQNIRDLAEIYPREKVNPGRRCAGRGDPGGAGRHLVGGIGRRETSTWAMAQPPLPLRPSGPLVSLPA